MRTLFSLFVIIGVTSFSCKKNPVTVPPGNGGNNSPITITSISPKIPYADDEITITGTGFNPDKTKDTVDFGVGDPVSGIFNPYAVNTNISKAVIISATATQLVLKAVNPDSSTTNGLNAQLFNLISGFNSVNRFRVRTNGLKAISSLTPFKQIPRIELNTVAANGVWLPSITDGGSSWITPNDSVRVFIYGYKANANNNTDNSNIGLSCSSGGACSFADSYLSFNGISPQCNCDNFVVLNSKLISYNATTNFAIVHFLVPANFFNTPVTNANPARLLIKMQVQNSDGKFKNAPIICWANPVH
jgi:hypothetical protein